MVLDVPCKGPFNPQGSLPTGRQDNMSTHVFGSHDIRTLGNVYNHVYVHMRACVFKGMVWFCFTLHHIVQRAKSQNIWELSP